MKVFADISVTLDGFIAGPDAGPEFPLGRGGDRLHEWIYGLASWRKYHGLEGGEENRDSEVLEEAVASTGAVVMGKGMFDAADDAWGEDPPFGKPVFVVTHSEREPLERGETTFHFVTDGVTRAIELASEAAAGKDVSVAGGANVIQQALVAGVLDEIDLHVVPVLIGDGTRLFENLGRDHIELQATRVIGSPSVTHLRFEVEPPAS